MFNSGQGSRPPLERAEGEATQERARKGWDGGSHLQRGALVTGRGQGAESSPDVISQVSVHPALKEVSAKGQSWPGCHGVSVLPRLGR